MSGPALPRSIPPTWCERPGGTGRQSVTLGESRSGDCGEVGAALRSSHADRSAVGAETPLVSNTEFADPPSAVGSADFGTATGETFSSSASREAKYLLQETARSLLPGHRVGHCCWWLARGAIDVGVNYSAAAQRASYSRLTRCGSVWACPVCAARITEQRAEEIRGGLASLLGRGGSAAFATFTVSHSHEDALETVLEGFLAAFRYLTSKPSYKRLRARYGVLGFVRVLEVTYGRNGWHVHSHVLYFLDRPMTADQLAAFESALFPLWESAAARRGLTMSRRYGLEVKRAYGNVEEYLAKYGRGPRWDMARELAKGHVKRGRSLGGLKHLTPWELLAAAAAGDRRCGRLFAEFVQRFDGKAQLWWSPGLRALLLNDAAEISDAVLASTLPPESVEVGAIASALWESVKRAKGRARVLQLVEESGGAWGPVEAYLAEVAAAFPPYVPRPRGELSPELRAALVQLHADQVERLRWRGPLSSDVAMAAAVGGGR